MCRTGCPPRFRLCPAPSPRCSVGNAEVSRGTVRLDVGAVARRSVRATAFTSCARVVNTGEDGDRQSGRVWHAMASILRALLLLLGMTGAGSVGVAGALGPAPGPVVGRSYS